MLTINTLAATNTIVGPGVAIADKRELTANPAMTDVTAVIDDSHRNCDMRLDHWRATAAGTMMRALESNAPRKRSPTSTVTLKANRKHRFSRFTFTPVTVAISGDTAISIRRSLAYARKPITEATAVAQNPKFHQSTP